MTGLGLLDACRKDLGAPAELDHWLVPGDTTGTAVVGDQRGWATLAGVVAAMSERNDGSDVVDWTEFASCLRTCTEAQVRVLWLVSAGLLNKQIAFTCGISEATVKSHVAAALKKLKIRTRTAAAVRFAVFLDRQRARR